MSIKKNDKIKIFGSEIEFKVFQMFVIIVILILFGPIIFISVLGINDMNKTGGIGDTFNGLTAPFISLLSAILVFLAFRAQVIANNLVNDQFKIQQIDTRFFELIKLHRDNVSEIGIGKNFGKKIFVMIIREYREIHRIIRIINRVDHRGLSNSEISSISFVVLFFGVGPNSSRQLKKALTDYDNNLGDRIIRILDNKKLKEHRKEKRKLKYTPFEGHQSRLGHYYRHLFHVVTFIDKQEILKDKYSYIKTLRAQLTTHEQALLFINSQTPMGKNWYISKENNLLNTYKLVKNIPLDFFNCDIEYNLEDYFPQTYFEYQED